MNECTHPDIYFALRGGINNFGIVTYFTMGAVKQEQLYSGQRLTQSRSEDRYHRAGLRADDPLEKRHRDVLLLQLRL